MPSLLQSDAALKGPYDVIYSDTSPLLPSSSPPRNHSTPDVSKEQRDIKHNYDGFSTPSADRRPQASQLRGDPVFAGRHASEKKHIGDFQPLPALRARGEAEWGGGRWEIKYTALQRRAADPSRQALYYRLR